MVAEEAVVECVAVVALGRACNPMSDETSIRPLPFTMFAGFLQAQLPEDALRMAYIHPSGTAREQAIGRTMGSLGGDITANYINPAGLAFYRTNEIVISPGWNLNSIKTSYLFR